MTPDDIAAQLKEQRGIQITGPGGHIYDHIGEVADARASVINNIEAIKQRLVEVSARGGPRVDIDVLEARLSALSDLLDSMPRPP